MSEPPYNKPPAKGSERRSSVRRPIQLAASLSFKTARQLTCEIADFCPEGVFVTFPPNTQQTLQSLHLVKGQTVGLSFHDPFVKRDHELKVAPVRLLEGAFGGMFTEGNTGAITALLRICGAENIRGKAPTAQPETASLLMRQCERMIKNHVEPLIGTFLRALPTKFDEAINKAATDNQKTNLADSVIAFRKQSGQVIPIFFQYVGEALVPRFSRNKDDSGEQQSSLSLIDKSEFEDWLTLKVMVTKAETAYRETLLKTKMRFDALGISSVKGYPNPVGPALICYAFRDTLMALQLPVVAERLCLKQFEISVLQDLQGLYQELDELLARQGILPDLDLTKYLKTPDKVKTPKKPEPAEPATAREDPPEAPSEVEQPARAWPDYQTATAAKQPAEPAETKPEPQTASAQASLQQTPKQPAAGSSAEPAYLQTPTGGESYGAYLATAEESVAAVNTLLATLRSQRQRSEIAEHAYSSFADSGEAPAFQNDEVLINLHHVQSTPFAQDALVDSTGLRERLAHLVDVKQVEKKALSSEQDKTLDVVDRFFASILKNKKITDVAKSQIKGLEVPLLRILLRNPEFFEQGNHAARQLIDRLAQVGVKGGRMTSAQIERINSMVMRIQAEHDHDPAVFDEALAEVDEIVERQNLLYRRNVERVTAAAEGQQKVEESKHAVAQAIHELMAGRKIPKAVATLLNGGWRDLLSLTYIRQGPESQAWHDYLNVVDTLIKVGQDATYEYNLPELLKIIQDGLSAISSNHIPSGHVRDEIKRLLVRKADEPPPEVVELPEIESARSEQDMALLQEARQRGLQRWLQRAQKLKAGDWLRMERDGKDPEFIRLVWIGKNFARYVFVNHQGMKVIDLDALTLAAYLQKGIAVPEPGVGQPVVDESLDTMVKDLYEQLSHAGTHDELTGLMLRKEFERQMLVMHAGLDDKATFSCMLISLEQFRIINDLAGTEAGDKVLKDISIVLKAKLSDDALICRYSGDEFVVAIPEAVAPWLAAAKQAVESYVLDWEGQEFKVTAGIGYLETQPGLMELRHMLRACEDACRSAKKKGTGNEEAYVIDKKQIEQRDAIAQKVANLGKELNEERLLLRCQKIIPLRSQSKLGVQHEILLSIYDEDSHLIPVGEFIRAAEGYKRMQEVDRWVVGRMLDWMVDNREKISQIGGIAINLSGHSLNDESLLEFIFERLTKYDCPLEKITFEITEAAAIAKLHDVSDFMKELQEYGCRFCLGNYGTGVISYQFLRDLPVDLIKVDGSFVRELANDENDRMMLRSMVEMAHYLKREVVAPQIETREAFEELKQIGVDYAQGYFIERPKSLANLWATLE